MLTFRVRVRVSILGGVKTKKVKKTKTIAKRETFMARSLAQKYVDGSVAVANVRTSVRPQAKTQTKRKTKPNPKKSNTKTKTMTKTKTKEMYSRGG